jgi:hypothetical protein
VKLPVSSWTAAEAANLFFRFVHINFFEQEIESKRGVQRKSRFSPENAGMREKGRAVKPANVAHSRGYASVSGGLP